MDVIISQVGGNVFSGVGGRELPKTAGIIVNVSAIVFIRIWITRFERVKTTSQMWRVRPLHHIQFVYRVGAVGLEPTKRYRRRFTVSPLCRSGHTPLTNKV